MINENMLKANNLGHFVIGYINMLFPRMQETSASTAKNLNPGHINITPEVLYPSFELNLPCKLKAGLGCITESDLFHQPN